MGTNPLVEMWALYISGSLLIFLRVACRWRMVGVRGFKLDDYMVWFSWVSEPVSPPQETLDVADWISHGQVIYTVMSVAADYVGRHADVHALTIEERKALTVEEAKPYVLVTKWFCIGVSTYIVFIWSLKLNMLFFYQRVVNGLWVEKFILPAVGLVVATLIAILIILFASCRPYNRMWEVYPDQGGKQMVFRSWWSTVYAWRNTLTGTVDQTKQRTASPWQNSICSHH